MLQKKQAPAKTKPAEAVKQRTKQKLFFINRATSWKNNSNEYASS